MQQEEAIHGETETAVETPVPGEAIENGASDEETVAASEEEAPVAEAEVVEPPAEAAQEAVAQEAVAQEAVAQEAVAQEAATQEAATQEVTTQEVDAEEAAPQEAVLQEAVAEEADTQGADAEVAPAEVYEAAETAVAEEAAAEAAATEAAVAEAEPEAGAASEPLTMEDWLDQVERVEEESAIHRGDIVEGEIVQTSPTEILIDVGAKAEGVISGRELERMDRQTLETLQPGSKVLVYVLNPEGRSGHPVLSLSRAQEEQDWRQAEEYRESQDVYEGKIAGYNKGGLIVRFGKVRGFVPASQISVERRRQSSGATPKSVGPT
ncbi:MAG: S1 RNA-binding domain-containing protein [Anaerolineae bacterium]|nr:S1 RNA-binding domain-containing protein [Anaerolineae bacterium]